MEYPIELADKLSPDDRSFLHDLAVPLEMNAGEIIFREGQRHSFVYWVVEGQVSLEMTSGGKTMRPLLTLDAGDLLAWSALLAERRMTVTAKTIRPTRLIQFDADRLLELCEASSEVGYRVMHHLATQLARRLLATRLQMLDLFEAPSESVGEVSR